MVRRALLILVLSVVAGPVHAQRLPGGVEPLHYDLTIAPDLAAATFAGEESIRVRVDKPTTTIVLNAAEIAFHQVTIVARGRTETATVSLDAAKEQVTLTLPQPLAAGEAEIRIQYSGILNKDLRGLYLSEANNRRYAVTQLEATDARRMFPSFDEPAFKATFALTTIIDSGDTAISNGVVLSDLPGPSGGKHTVKFATTPKMSTYLVALAVGDFVCNEGSADGIPLRICSTPDKKALTGFALESTGQIVRYLNRYHSVKYPFAKLDVVAVPDFAAGAMENTAAIFYREQLLLADETASVGKRKEIAVVLAHEIAHQWFGDLVTMKWWDDIWLNEGFANWMMTKPVKEWKPEWHVDLDEVRDSQKAMGLDALRATRPIRAKAETPAEINELFDPIAYEKGAAVLRMLEAWIGESDFRRGVNTYIEQFQYGNARAEDFWATLTRVTGKPVDKVMATFVDQPGVPLVSVNIACGSQGAAGRVELAQERYAVNPSDGSTVRGQLWQIPICLRTPSGKVVCDLLDQLTEPMPLGECPAWVVGNASGRGYYRTAEPPDAIRKAAAEVLKLTPAERIVLLSDEWALVRANRHDVGTFLDLAAGFRGETTAAVVQTLTSPLATIGTDLTTDGTRGAFQKWVAALLSPALSEVGLTPRPTDSDETRALRGLLFRALGETARDPQVLAKARELVGLELETPGSVERTLLDAVVGLAALEGNASLYDRYLTRSRNTADPSERYRYLYGLTSFTDSALVVRTMDLILSPEIRSQDAKLLIASMFGTRESRPLVWKLVRERWEEIQKRTGEFVGNGAIVGALGAFCETQRIEEIKGFFATHKVPDAARTLDQAIERIGACARLSDAQREKLAAWLGQRPGAGGQRPEAGGLWLGEEPR